MHVFWTYYLNDCEYFLGLALKTVSATFSKWRFTFEAVWAWLGPRLPGKSNFGHWSKPSLKLANSSGESEGFLVWCWGVLRSSRPANFSQEVILGKIGFAWINYFSKNGHLRWKVFLPHFSNGHLRWKTFLPHFSQEVILGKIVLAWIS